MSQVMSVWRMTTGWCNSPVIESPTRLSNNHIRFPFCGCFPLSSPCLSHLNRSFLSSCHSPSLWARHHRPPRHHRLPLSFHLHPADPTLPVCHPLLTWTVIQHQMCCGGLCVFRFKVLTAECCIIMWKFPSKRVDYDITPSLLGLYGLYNSNFGSVGFTVTAELSFY